MAEFKFLCPQCKQQVQCDTAHVGAQINCPVCQQAIVVPASERTVQIKVSTLRNVAIAGAGALLAVVVSWLVWHFMPFGQKLAGDWTYNGQPCQIVQKGQDLTFINERGDSAEGYFKDANTVIATDWEGGLIGRLSKDKKRISWRNGTVWIRAK